MAAPLALSHRNVSPDDVPPALARALTGRYRVVRRVASSAMSDVYLARQSNLERDVAIKVLNPAGSRDLVERGRFAREARTQAGLAHPCIVPVFEHGDQGALPYFVMPYVGGSLADRMPRAVGGAGRDVAGACTMLADVAEALGCAHGSGVVHRDIKPSNILVDARTGRGMVTDFGVAIVSTSDQSRSELCRGMGTPAYMAPEQILGDTDADGRGDIYSLGVVAFELFTGRLPVMGEAATDIPPVVAPVVRRCLELRPARRWADGPSLAAALREAVTERRGRWWHVAAQQLHALL